MCRAEEFEIFGRVDAQQWLHAVIGRSLGRTDRLQDGVDPTRMFGGRMHRTVEELAARRVRPLAIVPEAFHEAALTVWCSLVEENLRVLRAFAPRSIPRSTSVTHFPVERDPRFAADLASLVSGSPTAKRGSKTQAKAAAFRKV